MSLPFRTYTDSITLLSYLVSNKETTANISLAYNLAYREIMLSYEWYARLGETMISTANPYSTGTVNATQGSNQIAGVGTAWSATQVGLYLKIGFDNQYYKITAVDSVNQIITTELAYAPTSQTGSAYAIFGLQYSLPPDVSDTLFYAAGNTNPLAPRDVNYLTFIDPNRLEVDAAPVCYVLHGPDTSGNLTVEFWPRPPSSQAFRLLYKKRVDDLSGTQYPLIRSDLIETLALYYICSAMDAKFGDQHWDRRAKSYYERHQVVLDEAKQEDLNRWKTPDSIQWERPIVRGAQYYVLHDVP